MSTPIYVREVDAIVFSTAICKLSLHLVLNESSRHDLTTKVGVKTLFYLLIHTWTSSYRYAKCIGHVCLFFGQPTPQYNSRFGPKVHTGYFTVLLATFKCFCKRMLHFGMYRQRKRSSLLYFSRQKYAGCN